MKEIRAEDSATEKLDIHLRYVFEGVNFKERIISLIGEIDHDMFLKFDAALTEMESHNKRGVTVKIFSEGGYVDAGLAIVGRLRNSKCKITTEGYGCVMSAASLILAAGTRRRFSEFGSFMHHEFNYGIEGRHSEIKAYVKQTETQMALWAEWLARFSKKDKKFYAAHGTHVDTYWTAKELLEYGIVDEII
jgi:ATP-dependent Clp protease protease subunit